MFATDISDDAFIVTKEVAEKMREKEGIEEEKKEEEEEIKEEVKVKRETIRIPDTDKHAPEGWALIQCNCDRMFFSLYPRRNRSVYVDILKGPSYGCITLR